MSSRFLLIFLALAVMSANVVDSKKKKKKNGKPNIVVFLIDDMGFGDLGFTGAGYSTPHIDALKAEGLFFDRYYVEPVCTPSRSALLTGYYPHDVGTQRPFSAGSNATLPLHLDLLSNVMKRADYDTYLFGKWHLGYLDWDYTPVRRGFDEFIGIFQGEGHLYDHVATLRIPCGGGPTIAGYDFWKDTTLFDTRNETNMTKKFATRIYREAGKRVIGNHGKKKKDKDPMLLIYSFQTIHTPFVDPPKVYPECNFPAVAGDIAAGTNKMGKYCGMMKYVDETVGEAVALLKTTGLWDNTLVILSTENGGVPYPLKVPGFAEAGEGSNYPYRGAKGGTFEGGIHGVGMVAGGVLAASLRGQTSSALIHVSDWYTTLADLAGVSVTAPNLDGVSQKCVIENTCTNVRNDLFAGMQEGQSGTVISMINGTLWKYIKLPGFIPFPYYAFSQHRTTGIPMTTTPCGAPLADSRVNPFGTNELLFDLSSDPHECVNVISTNPTIVLALQAKLTGQNVVPAIQPPGGGRTCEASPSFLNGVWDVLYGSPTLPPKPMSGDSSSDSAEAANALGSGAGSSATSQTTHLAQSTVVGLVCGGIGLLLVVCSCLVYCVYARRKRQQQVTFETEEYLGDGVEFANSTKTVDLEE